LLLLNDSIGVYSFVGPTDSVLTKYTEFIISDLALASHSITSHTLTSAKLLAYVLESFPPAAIIAHAELLPHLLELLYEADYTVSRTIIVVGEPSARALASVASNIKVHNFADVEREGVKTEKILTSAPGNTKHINNKIG
jgi:long-chain acyl-CoA synthetase